MCFCGDKEVSCVPKTTVISPWATCQTGLSEIILCITETRENLSTGRERPSLQDWNLLVMIRIIPRLSFTRFDTCDICNKSSMHTHVEQNVDANFPHSHRSNCLTDGCKALILKDKFKPGNFVVRLIFSFVFFQLGKMSCLTCMYHKGECATWDNCSFETRTISVCHKQLLWTWPKRQNFAATYFKQKTKFFYAYIKQQHRELLKISINLCKEGKWRIITVEILEGVVVEAVAAGGGQIVFLDDESIAPERRGARVHVIHEYVPRTHTALSCAFSTIHEVPPTTLKTFSVAD